MSDEYAAFQSNNLKQVVFDGDSYVRTPDVVILLFKMAEFLEKHPGVDSRVFLRAAASQIGEKATDE